MSRFRIDRRTMLRGLGGIAVGLPFLEAMHAGRAVADTPKPPKRFIVMFTPNGTVQKDWLPASTGPGYTASTILEPLDTPTLRPRTTIVSGLSMPAADLPANGHARGVTAMLVGRRFTDNQGEVFSTDAGDMGWAADISIDQALAKRVAAPGQLPSIELGIQSDVWGSDWSTAISYGEGGGSQNAIRADSDPRSTFTRLFKNVADGQQSDAEAQAIIAKRTSVLDLVQDDFERLRGKLGKADQQRLDKHLSLVAELESRIGEGIQCDKPAGPTFSDEDIGNYYRYPDLGKAQMDVLAVALACDLTRVATVQWSGAQGGFNGDWVEGVDPSAWQDTQWWMHHPLSHEGAEDKQYMLSMVNRWYAQQLAYLGDALAAIPDVDGSSVLDNTAILWTSEVADGGHHFDNMPYVIVGGLGGTLRTGEHLAFEGRTNNDLFLTIAKGMGVQDMATFGDPGFCNGPIEGLLM